MISLSDDERQLVRQPLSRKDVVYTLLRAAIIDGRLKAGLKLDQNEIAANFNVSRMPVREALKQLELEGLVVVYPYRGVEVAQLDPVEIVELFAIRGALERLAVGRAVDALGADDLAALQDLLERMDALGNDAAASQEWIELNGLYHERINAAGGWDQLLDAISTYRDKVDRYVRVYFSRQGRERAQQQHWALFEALKTRDADKAQAIIEDHSISTANTLLESIGADI